MRRVEEAKKIMEKQMLEELEKQREAELEAQRLKEVGPVLSRTVGSGHLADLLVRCEYCLIQKYFTGSIQLSLIEICYKGVRLS